MNVKEGEVGLAVGRIANLGCTRLSLYKIDIETVDVLIDMRDLVRDLVAVEGDMVEWR